MALFRKEPKFIVVDSFPRPDSRKLDPGEFGSITRFSTNASTYGKTIRRVEIIEDDVSQIIQRNREVIVRFLDGPSGVYHRVRRYVIVPDKSPTPVGRLQAVQMIGKIGMREDVFLPTFTWDEQHTIASPLTHIYADCELARNKRHYWVFRDYVYSTTEPFSPEEMTALLLDDEKRKKARVERALQRSSRVAPAESPQRRQPIPDDVKMFVWKRDEGKCVKCGSNRNLEFDHIIPWSMGGSDTARNLQLLCEVCNKAKGGNLA